MAGTASRSDSARSAERAGDQLFWSYKAVNSFWLIAGSKTTEDALWNIICCTLYCKMILSTEAGDGQLLGAVRSLSRSLQEQLPAMRSGNL
jgi:hypothetical protein